MNLLDLLDKKKNLFEHLFYEFEMYLKTYAELGTTISPDQEDADFKRNVLLESHAIHLRNLIEFFNCEKNCLNMDTVFTGNHDLSFDDSTIKAKQTINKTIDHLTKERYTWNQTEQDLTIRFNAVIHLMYNYYIVARIKSCISLLANNTDINANVYSDLQDTGIQARLQNLERVLHIQ